MRAGERRAEWAKGYPREDDLDAVAMMPSGPDAWSPRHIVRRSDGLVVGSIGFFGPPEPGDDGVAETEVGYGLVEDARGAGLATEALTAMLARTRTPAASACASIAVSASVASPAPRASSTRP